MQPTQDNLRPPAPVVLAITADPSHREAIRHDLDSLYYRLEFADGIAAARRALRGQALAVVVADADGDGGAAWRTLLRKRGRRYVVVMSRQADEAMWMEVLDKGGVDLLPKPFVPKELRRVVEAAVADWLHLPLPRPKPGQGQTFRTPTVAA